MIFLEICRSNPKNCSAYITWNGSLREKDISTILYLEKLFWSNPIFHEIFIFFPVNIYVTYFWWYWWYSVLMNSSPSRRCSREISPISDSSTLTLACSDSVRSFISCVTTAPPEKSFSRSTSSSSYPTRDRGLTPQTGRIDEIYIFSSGERRLSEGIDSLSFHDTRSIYYPSIFWGDTLVRYRILSGLCLRKKLSIIPRYETSL